MNYDPEQIFSKMGYSKDCKGKNLALLFEQPSTRTLMSFELAARMVGAEAVRMPRGMTSQEKGESLEMTFQALGDMGYDAVVYRGYGDPGDPGIPVINAGNEALHPTQALIDLYTAEQSHWPKDHSNTLRVQLAGDVNSRVAESVRLVFANRGHEIVHDKPNILMVFRWQDGRPVTDQIKEIPPDCYLMAPGPVLDEVHPDIMYHPRSLIRKQIANSVFVRMGVLRHAFRKGRQP